LVDAMLRWRTTRWGGCVMLSVHDEIIVMVPEADGAAATAALVECMQTEFHGVPITVKADQPSQSWTDAA
jgi:DNA polymerase I-like protein with 3'-5' exonuclease and polymerase domains